MSAPSGRLWAGRRTRPPAFVGAGLSFLVASAAVAAWNADEGFAHGWWLVSFLALVGGVAQLLLGAGHGRLRASSAGVREREAVLWNAGTLLVPLGVLAQTRLAVVIGSLLLLTALGGLSLELGGRGTAKAGGAPCWRLAYAALLAFLAASVLVGTALAWDLPWT